MKAAGAPSVGRVWVGAGPEQRLRGSRSTEAQRPPQWGLAGHGPGLEVGPTPHELPDDRGVPSLGRRVEWGRAVDEILGVDVRAGVQKYTRRAEVPSLHGEPQRRQAIAGRDGFGGRAGGHESARNVRASVDGCDVEGGVASGVPCGVRVKPRSEQRRGLSYVS